jgi:hypothetical protein
MRRPRTLVVRCFRGVDCPGPWRSDGCCRRFNPREWRTVWQAQGVLAELLGVDVDQADRGLRNYAKLTAASLFDVAWLVVHLRLVIARDLCLGPSPLPGGRAADTRATRCGRRAQVDPLRAQGASPEGAAGLDLC